MTKRLKNLLFLSLGIAVAVSTASFSYFYLKSSETPKEDAVQDIRVDNIFENYSSIQKDFDLKKFSDVEYTIYIFPSTEYMQIYGEYVNDVRKNVNNPGLITKVKPEDFAGHLEPLTNDDGTLKLDNEGKPQYKVVNHNVDLEYAHPSHPSNIYPADNYVKRVEDTYSVAATQNQYKYNREERELGTNRYWHVYTKDETTYYNLKKESIVLKSYNNSTYYKPMEWWNRVDGYNVIDNTLPFISENAGTLKAEGLVYDQNAGYQKRVYETYNFYAEHAKNKLVDDGISPITNSYRTYGLPGETTFRKSADYINNVGGVKDTYNYLLGDNGAPDCSKALYSTDRFGFWEDLTLEDGRFLPIKLKVRNSISPQVFRSAYGEIGATINDGHTTPWYEARFNEFTYAFDRAKYYTNLNGKKAQEPSFPLNDLRGSLLESDIKPRDLACSFDLNNIFDITKNLSNYADDDNVIRLFPTFGNNKGYYAQTKRGDEALDLGGKDSVKMELDFLFNSESNPFLSRIFYPVYSSSLPGSYTDKNGQTVYVNYCSISSVRINIRKGIRDTKTHMRLSMAYCEGGPASWNSDWHNNIYDLDFSDPNIMKYLNGPGIYNFYFFIGNSGRGKTELTDSEGLKTHLDKYSTREAMFPHLEGKKMRYIPLMVNGKEHYYSDSRNIRPVALFAQKATEPKLFSDLDLTYSAEKLNSVANLRHDYAPTAFQIDNPLYTNKNGGNRVYLSKLNTNENHPNTYIFKGVDFTKNSFDALQIRYGNLFNNRIGFTNDDPLDSESDATMYSTIYPAIYVNNKGGTLPTNNPDHLMVFEPMLGSKAKSKSHDKPFFIKRTHKIKNNDDEFDTTSTDISFIETDGDKNRGIYDILMVLNQNYDKYPKDANGQPKFDAMFDLYCFRHTNIFIKLFDHKLSKTDKRIDPITKEEGLFIEHEDINGNNVAGCLWQRRFFIGDTIRANQVSDIKVDGVKKKFEQALLDYMKAKGIAKKDVMVKDQITDTPIVWYNPSSTAPDGYEIYINKSFKVLKNYIFYVSTRDQNSGKV